MSVLSRLDPVASGRQVGTLRPWAPVAGVGALAVVALTRLATVDPNQPGHYPACPFRSITGLYCPGCGALRATHDLLHGDLAGALARNPVAVLAVPYLLGAFATWVWRLSGRPAPRSTQLPPWMIWAILVVVVAFGVARNLPGMSWLSPA